jgi:hypothetical protein
MVYLWLVTLGLQTFVLPDEMPLEIPQDVVTLMFLLYGVLIVLVLAGTIVAAMIDNRFYQKLFGGFLITAFVTFLGVKGMFG